MDDPILEQDWRNWALAAGILCAATACDFLLQSQLDGRVTWLIYFPALVLTAFYAGLGPSLLVLVGALLAVVTFWIEPVGAPFFIANVSDRVATLLFGAAGVAVAIVASQARRLVHSSSVERLHMDIALTMGNMVAWTWDIRSGQVTYSSNTERLFGAQPVRVEDTWALLHPDDMVRCKRIAEDALKEGRSEYGFLCRTRSPGGPLRWAQVRGQILRDPQGRATHVRGVSADVTELATAQDQLRQELERKDNFLATLAHELRNPMAPIRYATAMLGERASPEQRQWARDVIARQSAHMARLLDDLLDMSRITRDVIELHPELFDLRTAIGHAIDNVRAAIVAHHHALQVDLPPAPVWITGDQTRIQQVLGNLLDNAAKYTPDGGRLRVLLESMDAQAVVHVVDNGIGIPAGQESQVFELFTQLHEPGSNAGLGIGLAIVKRLVELHGGAVGVRSDGPGHGCEFTVRLPQEQDAHGASARTMVAAAARAYVPTRSIVVVDDNVDTAETLAAVLRGAGYTVRAARDGQEALEAFEALHPAAVVLDVGLPDMSGLEVAEHMRTSAGQAVALVAVTGWDQFREQGAQPVFDLVLVKPVDPAELQRRLAVLLAKPVAA